MDALNIGVLSETRVQQHYLSRIIQESGAQVGHSLLMPELLQHLHHDANIHPPVDAWVMDIDMDDLDESLEGKRFQHWLSQIDVPVILSEGSTRNAAEAEFLSWTRQLYKKLLHLEGQIQQTRHQPNKARYLWVLAASTGGPDMIKRFLDAMESDLGIAFLYAQHIGQSQSQALATSVARDSQYQACVPSHGHIITANSLIVVSPEQQIELQTNGTLTLHANTPWRGVYQPSIDQVVANVARIRGHQSGVIFFTGLGEDGVVGARLMALKQGQVWAQSVASCVAPQMPQAVINSGHTNKIDTVESLAIHLKAWATQQHSKEK